MLFNSVEFIFAFFPITVFVFFWLARSSHLSAASWLTLASLFFYGWWNPAYVLLLLASVAFNYASGFYLARLVRAGRQILAGSVLAVAVTLNLALLAYYKYANFFLHVAAELTGATSSLEQIVLPLGISFFTFTQLAFLVDVYRGFAQEYNPVHYGLFVTYFPHLIAGPVLHHREMMPQFQQVKTYRLNWDDVAVGLTILRRSMQEDGRRRWPCAVRYAVVCHTGPARSANSLGRSACLYLSTLLRFLWLFGHGHWSVACIRREVAAQFQLALQGRKHHRLLAALAYDAVPLSARLPLYLFGRQSERIRVALHQPNDHNGSGGTLARRGLDLHRVGRVARRIFDGESPLAHGTNGAGTGFET